MLMVAVSAALVLLIGIFGYAAVLPSEYAISRSITIGVYPDLVFPHINNPQLTNAWMPWSDEDPTMVVTYSGPKKRWCNNRMEKPGEHGRRKAEVVESIQDKYVKTRFNNLSTYGDGTTSGNATHPRWRRNRSYLESKRKKSPDGKSFLFVY